MQDQRATLTWRDGSVPVSTRFDDPYYSLENGLAETRHVFLAGNRLPERFADGFHIAELGFGTGLSALVAAQAIPEGCGRVHFTSFEAHPMRAEDMAQALSVFPELGALAQALVDQWRDGARVIELPRMMLTVIEGDARLTLPDWNGKADAWFLDGFSPAKNPELWDGNLMQAVHDHTVPTGTFATYTAAGFVRRALAEAGFAVERISGYGRKRHMSIGQRA